MYSQRPSRSRKILVGSLGILFGISHIGLVLEKSNRLPIINLPVGPYTSYIASVSEKGYTIKYRSHAPKIIQTEKSIDKPAGFLGLGKAEINTYEQSVAGEGTGSVSESSELTAKQIACIKAEGSGEATGKLAAASITAPITPALTEIPYVGWLVAGFFNMFGQKQGGEIGGQMARDFADC
jgi:hypothetical protein|tara:strand:+ start:600 stop:1142 length:543 start_codon:yes stop_codon:yes gene_type:complete